MKKGMVVVTLLAAVMVLAAAAYAVAGSQTFGGAPGGNSSASGTVSTTVTVNPKITLTITTPDNPGLLVNFGAVDPGSTVTRDVNLQVGSNKAYTISSVAAGTITDPNLSFSTSPAPAFSVNEPKGTNDYLDTYSISPSFDATATDYTGTVQYTVTQN